VLWSLGGLRRSGCLRCRSYQLNVVEAEQHRRKKCFVRQSMRAFLPPLPFKRLMSQTEQRSTAI
jgi:hypothetical protein